MRWLSLWSFAYHFAGLDPEFRPLMINDWRNVVVANDRRVWAWNEREELFGQAGR